MKLETQVASLALCRRLKELGVNQESAFYWCDVGNKVIFWRLQSSRIHETDVAAFTVAELGELLSMVIGGRNKAGIGSSKWWCQQSHADTEADARALALIAEIEQGVTKP